MTTPSANGQRAYLLFGHGARNPEWAVPLQAAQAALTARLPAGTTVTLAFLEFLAPTLEEAIESLAPHHTEIVVVPWFIAPGEHLLRDLPALIANAQARYPHLSVILLDAIGTWPEVIAAIADAVVARTTP